MKSKEIFEAVSYDEIFNKNSIYSKHYNDIELYIDVWNYIISILNISKKYVDLGCGPGHLGHIMYDKGFKNYTGIDFSKVALDMARDKVSKYEWVEGDLRKFDFTEYRDCDFLSVETFEHIDDDINVIQNLPKNNIIFSVPSYMSVNHYRVYEDEEYIMNYYKDVLDIHAIKRFTVSENNYIFVVNATII